jgi:uncharacterized membrane protein
MMKRVPPDDATGRANASRGPTAAVRGRFDTLLHPAVTERLIDSLTGFVTGRFFWTLNLVVVAWWIVVNSGVIPDTAAFDPSFFKLFYLVIPLEALCLITLVGLNRHYLKRRTEQLNEVRRLMRHLEDEEN